MTTNLDAGRKLPMELRSLAMALLLAFLLLSQVASVAVSFTSPSPSPSPAPASHRTLPKQLDRDLDGVPRRPPGIPSLRAPPDLMKHGHHQGRNPVPASTGKPKLNYGEKIGLAFAGVAAGLQVALGGVLVLKRWQLKKVERDDRGTAVSSSNPPP
nr:PREDICTED: uncharacterized protein LOC108953320 [Musa acuminata subsp. malaccensis]